MNNPVFATAVGLLLRGINMGAAGHVARQRPRQTPVAAQAEFGGNPYAVADNAPQRTINSMYGERNNVEMPQQEATPETEPQEESAAPKEKKGGIFGRWKRKLDSMFEVIEDNDF